MDVDEDDIARLERLELTHVAPVDVNGWGVFIGADDDVERVVIVEEGFLVVWLVERGFVLDVEDASEKVDSEKENANY